MSRYAASAQKRLLGNLYGSSQRKFPGAVAFDEMSRAHFFERRFHLGANIFDIPAARVEIATFGRVGRVGHFTRKENAFLARARIRERNGGH